MSPSRPGKCAHLKVGPNPKTVSPSPLGECAHLNVSPTRESASASQGQRGTLQVGLNPEPVSPSHVGKRARLTLGPNPESASQSRAGKCDLSPAPAASVVSDVLASKPGRGLSSLHVAELCSQELLARPPPIACQDVQQLFDLLPADRARSHSRLREDDGSKAFSVGCFSQGPLHGLLQNTRNFPLTTAVLAQFVKEQCPEAVFSTISLYLNRRTAMHRDSANAALPNFVVAVSSFQGGGVWVQDSQGTEVKEVAGSPVNGTVHDLSRPLKFDAHALYHCTLPWEGDRLVAVAFSVAKLHAFPLEDVKFLQSQGFPLPEAVSPCSSVNPPLEHGSPLAASLERLEQRIAGKPLKDLVFLEVFAGSAGLTAAVRRLGLPLARGLDRTVGQRCHAPVTVLDLTRSESQQIIFAMLQAGEVAAYHLAPPCGTASKARDINNGGPPPMRSTEQPDGLCSLDASLVPRLQAANTLYLLCAKVVQLADKVGFLVSVENPAGSYMWQTSMWKSCSAIPLLRVLLHP